MVNRGFSGICEGCPVGRKLDEDKRLFLDDDGDLGDIVSLADASEGVDFGSVDDFDEASEVLAATSREITWRELIRAGVSPEELNRLRNLHQKTVNDMGAAAMDYCKDGPYEEACGIPTQYGAPVVAEYYEALDRNMIR